MAENITLGTFSTLQNSSIISTLNSNNALIQNAFTDCVSLKGTAPNAMQSNLDMNSFNILNLPAPATIHSPVRVSDVTTNITGIQLSSGYFTPQMFGAKGDGVQDDTAAVQACVNAANGVIPILVPAGTYIISGSSGVFTTANSIFIGEGSNVSKFKAAPSAQNFQLFVDVNGGNNQFYNIGFYGNNINPNPGTGPSGAFFMSSNLTSGPSYLLGPTFSHCYFENFATEGWIRVSNTGTIPIIGTKITDNTFISLTGNLSGGNSVSINSSCIVFTGNQSSVATPGPGALTGTIQGSIVSNNYADCGNLKSFCLCFCNVKDTIIASNYIKDCGKLASNNVGSYAITMYDNYGNIYGGTDSNFTNYLAARATGKIIGNTIIGSRDTGIYLAHGFDSQVLDNRIDTTLNTSPVSLAIGGIALDGAENVLIDGNFIKNCPGGTAGSTLCGGIVGIAHGTQGLIIGDNNTIINTQNGVFGIVILPKVVANDTQGPVYIGNVRIDLSGTTCDGIVLNSSGTNIFTQIYIKSPIINTTYSGIFTFDSINPGFATGLLKIENPVITGFSNSGISATIVTTGRIEIDNPTLDMSSGGIGINLTGSTDFSVASPIYKNSTVAYAFQTDGSSKGTVQGGIFRGCTAGHLANTLGTSAPTFTYNAGSFIKNYTPTIVGVSPNSYFVDGWKNITGGATWVEQRTGLI